ncbi:tripartite tricarboxylate transporter TctB family protein [Paenisporosarcina antarctica]|uniref:Tripartite tricarboxylate transporter TctB family protein n=1 Tax=Paenisporosarcina antarctica TaxID=417367 RepID=A0A4P7A1J5_9BACL|nr:tripartite tricarboxylate transporter TctB family protein [Paenisporosarcina antarctica]QBP42722.1 tripartite tricarboxylate transporter TctB family protein [Paenisporosarcina antarctica]
MFRLFLPIIFFLVGATFLISSLNLPKARLGDPYGPMYYPTLVSGLLILLSVIYIIQEWRKRHDGFPELELLLKGRTPFLLISTIVLSLIYAFLFEKIGFLFSTIIFLGGLLFIINGRKKWISNIVIAICFSGLTWYSFAILLKVSLP